MLANACSICHPGGMDKSRQAGGFARARSLSAASRSRIARKAARARWSSSGRNVLTIAQIRKTVCEALAGRDAKAFLFGSYARGEAKLASLKEETRCA